MIAVVVRRWSSVLTLWFPQWYNRGWMIRTTSFPPR